MRIAVNALLVYGQYSGVQHAILHQLRALLDLESGHEFVVVALEDAAIEEQLGDRRYTVLRAPVRSGQRMQRILWEQLSLPGALSREDVDLLYAPGYLTSLRWRGPSVVFVHDTIALSHPELCTAGNVLNYRLLLPPSARAATLVATPSHASARDVATFCGVPRDRIRVAPLGVEISPVPTDADKATALAQLGLPSPLLLAISTIEPKKNFDSLIRWFSAWKYQGLPHHLAIVGKWGWGTGPVRAQLAISPFKDCIHLPGYLPQASLPPLI